MVHSLLWLHLPQRKNVAPVAFDALKRARSSTSIRVPGRAVQNGSDMSELLPVLVVEDEEVLLSFLKTALQRAGVKAIGASCGAEALGLLEQQEFAGVVSDLRMPGAVGGAEIFDWVRQNRPELAKSFLFITGNASDVYAVEIRERTGALFIEKPFRIALLIELVKKITAWNEQIYV